MTDANPYFMLVKQLYLKLKLYCWYVYIELLMTDIMHACLIISVFLFFVYWSWIKSNSNSAFMSSVVSFCVIENGMNKFYKQLVRIFTSCASNLFCRITCMLHTLWLVNTNVWILVSSIGIRHKIIGKINNN